MAGEEICISYLGNCLGSRHVVIRDARDARDARVKNIKSETAIDLLLDFFPAKKKTKCQKKSKKVRDFKSKNGFIKIFDFLRKILNHGHHNDAIDWIGSSNTAFRISNPKKLASMWGLTKKKCGMTYSKLARAIRYGYGKTFKKGNNKYEYEFIL